MDDKTLQKAQLKQHKIFQNFPTSPALVAPNAHPLPTGANPKVSPLLKPNDSDNNSPETLFDIKTDNTLLGNNDKSLTQTHTCKNQYLLTFLHDRGSLNDWLYNHKYLNLMVSPPFQF